MFCGVVALLLFLQLLPLSAGTVKLPGSDLALCLAFVWVLRRPGQLPAPVIALCFFIQGAILLQPPGLWAAIVLLGTEAARLREARWRDQRFMVEWLRVAVLIGAMMLAYRFAQVLFMIPVPPLGRVILQFIATVAAYPLVVGGARLLLGLRRMDPVLAEQMRFAK